MRKTKQNRDWREVTLLPAATSSYQPVGHVELITLITRELNAQGYRVLTNTVNPAKDGQEIVGTMSLHKDGNDDSLPFTYMFGYMNSYNKHLPIKLAAGAYVFICGNGMVVGEIFSYRKHTSGVGNDLQEMIKNAVASIESAFQKSIADTRLMQDTLMTPYEIAELLGVLCIHKQYLSITELSAVVQQYHKPAFDCFAGNSMWSVYNHITYVLKDAPPVRRLNALRNVHNFLTDKCNQGKRKPELFTEFENE